MKEDLQMLIDAKQYRVDSLKEELEILLGHLNDYTIEQINYWYIEKHMDKAITHNRVLQTHCKDN